MKKNLVFYPFLLAIYPILFILGHNKLWVSPFIIGTCLSYILISLCLFFLLNFFLKDKHKSALISSYWIILFYQGGGSLNLVFRIVVVIIALIITIILSYITTKTKKDLSKISPILNFMALVLIILSVLSIIQGQWELKNLNTFYKNEEIENIIKAAPKSDINPKTLPNIYYIIPDEYAGFNSLKEYYNFDNQKFKEFLIQKEFYIIPNSISNYNYTAMSVNSSLNMEYIKYKVSKNVRDEVCMRHIFDNNLIRILKAYGYESTTILNDWHESRNLSEKYFSNWDSVVHLVSPSFNYRVLLRRSTVLRFILFDYFGNERREYNLSLFDFLNKFAIEQKNKVKPQFIYFHVLLPHQPCLFDENGKAKWSTTATFKKRYYPGQVKYTNKLLEHSVDTILENDKNAIIIIQSDHGYRGLVSSKKNISVSYNNMMAIYIPEKYRSKTKLYPTITPVNIFRTILNPVLNINLKKLPDKRMYPNLK